MVTGCEVQSPATCEHAKHWENVWSGRWDAVRSARRVLVIVGSRIWRQSDTTV